MVFPPNLNTLLAYVNYVLFILNQAKNTTNHFLQVICQGLRTPLNFLILLLFQLMNSKYVLRCFPFCFCLVSTPPDKPMRGKQTVVRPGATLKHFRAVPSNHCSCPPQTRILLPKRGLCPKEIKRFRATGVQFQA